MLFTHTHTYARTHMQTLVYHVLVAVGCHAILWVLLAALSMGLYLDALH